MHPRVRLRTCNVLGAQLYKKYVRSIILSILDSYWLQHARSVHEVYEVYELTLYVIVTMAAAPYR